jgi:hypothetical protein
MSKEEKQRPGPEVRSISIDFSLAPDVDLPVKTKKMSITGPASGHGIPRTDAAAAILGVRLPPGDCRDRADDPGFARADRK